MGPGSSPVVSTALLVTGNAIPSPSAAFGLTGGKTPVGFDPLTSPARQVGPMGQVISLRLITI